MGKILGMDKADKHADPVWWQCMLESGRFVALAKPFFNADDLLLYMHHRYPGITTHELRATGPLMNELKTLGYALPTNDFIPSRQKDCHSTPRRVWYSLLYHGKGKPRRPRYRKIHDPRQYFMDLSGATP
jgi:hypothetical protein